MAYVGIDQADVGGQFPIRVNQGEVISAKVVQLPFYDPDNHRQEM